jgi:hypothetical protein
VIRTVDLVITGAGSGALAAAADALQRGRRILVLLRPGDARVGQRFRRCLCKAANVNDTQVTVMTNAEVVCVDGVNGVEAVASAMRGPTAVRRKRVRLPVVPTARRSRHVSTTLVTDDATHAPCNQLGTAAVVGSMLATIAVANSEDGHALVRALSRILFDQRRRAGRRAWWRTVYYYSIRLSGQAWDSN